ncbi:MAG: SsrA-binding protein [Candidatus Melainabacteria bacterium HGW-Melainabacteria-1]|nr:MAG: SsrA-binding protein [Candidatus Melainabacteria bacterium HGW-Melainabacteria-1]
MSKDESRQAIVNRKAYHDYEVMEKFEAGIELRGTEVKAIRGGHANLRDNYAQVTKGELWVHNLHISPYRHGNIMNHEPLRPRRLLLHKREIQRLIGKTQEKGLTLIVLRLYWKGNYLKAEVGLCRGKKLHDKRAAMADRDVKRQIQRAMRRDLE